jgi:hypothetical protein
MKSILVPLLLPLWAIAAAPANDAMPFPAEVTPTVVGAAGDIACGPEEGEYNQGHGTPTACQEKATSELLLKMDPKAVLAVGDLVYPKGESKGFAQSFDATWGRLKAVLHPAVGNHEYYTEGAKPYFDYFGSAAGERGKGWYSFDVGGWHFISLNSNCDRVDCTEKGEQVRWLKQDLAAHAKTRCTLAFFHHPLFSSGIHGGTAGVKPFWDALYAQGADVVLSGHDHHYERFAPQRPDATPDAQRGLRELIVGTGGKSHYAAPNEAPNSEVRRADAFGVLKLTLYPTRYHFEFISTDGSFHDEGDGTCH